MMILQHIDLPSANFTSFIKSAKLLKLDTSPLENAIEKQKQDRASAMAEKSEKIKQKPTPGLKKKSGSQTSFARNAGLSEKSPKPEGKKDIRPLNSMTKNLNLRVRL